MTQILIKAFIKNSENTTDNVVRTNYGKMAGVVGIVCNLFLCIFKFLAGIISGSIAIMADAVNNLSDASSSIITLIGFKMAAKPADKKHPYGHARVEYISGLAVAMMIIIIGVELGKSSFDKILNPTQVDFSILTAIILVVSVGIKLWMMAFNRKIGFLISSQTLAATAMDSRNDVITTTAVLIGAIISAFFKVNLDGYMGICVAAFIIFSGFGIVKDTLDPILGAAPDEELVKYVNQKILSYNGVLGTHDLTVHDYGPGRRFASVHVEMAAEENVLTSHDIIDNIERDFLNNDKLKLVIHYDPILTGDEAVGTMRTRIKSIVESIGKDLSIHDFRMVQGTSHTNLIFDVVVPAGSKYNNQQLLTEIQNRVSAEDSSFYTVVTIDESFITFS